MDCTTARILAELPGNRATELPPEDVADLDAHLQTCSACRRQLQIERMFDAPIARAMQAVAVPAGLKSRLLDQVATQRGALHRRRFFYAAAAAAAVLAAVGLATWKPHNQVQFNFNEFARNLDNPHPQAEAWLKAQGVDFQPPVTFDPRLLAWYGMAPVQGKQAPMLYFWNAERNVYAMVFILRPGEFDLAALARTTYSGSLINGHVEISVDPAQPTRPAYVIVFTGDSLEPFMLRSQST